MSMIGKILGSFECTALLGKGGMGEVYRAKDHKLGRDVAIKVLPEEFAKDSDRVARFQREAKLLASLNHPNIAAIHGLEESDGTHFLVLELIEGDTLADRLKRGAIPVEESLKLALQISEALEAAHEKGVIHRDLKPANIKVTPDGKVKVLDFGLAKAFAGEQAEVNLSHSPTLSEAATLQGVILGTAAYMSPEQARGKPVDKRTDIWAFGCVLYEMLTGKAAFQGEDVTEILAAVVKSGVSLDLLPANIHPRVREVIIRCLQKEQKKRYGGIGEAQYEIDQVLADPSGVFVQANAAVESKKKLRQILSWITAAVVLSAVVTGVAVWRLKPAPPLEPRSVVRLNYELPEDQRFSNLGAECIAASPDGTQVAYSTSRGIYLRSMSELQAKLISGTDENPERPFFSPDGKWIGYWSNSSQQLKKIAVSGGASVPLTNDAALGRYSWGEDDSIIYCQGANIRRVSANGGIPETLAKVGTEGTLLVSPQILPDGKSVLFSRVLPTPAKILVKSLESGETKELFEGDTARFLPTGHIIYEVGDNLTVVPFNLDRLEVTGGTIPIVEGILTLAAPQYAVSNSGMLVYMNATIGSTGGSKLVWVDREGNEKPINCPSDRYLHLKISPDGTKAALGTIGGSGSFRNIWIYDFVRETRTRLVTFDESMDFAPIWTPDGQRIVFTSMLREGTSLYWKAANGTGETVALGPPTGPIVFPESWSSDGKLLALTEADLELNNTNISTLAMKDDGARKLLLQEKYSESQAQISPNGSWMAYASNKEGRNEIYVCTFPDVSEGQWQISEEGGESPLWSPHGEELFYRNGEMVMSISVEYEPSFRFSTPRILFQGAYSTRLFGGRYIFRTWDMSPEGRFLMLKEFADEGSTEKGIQPEINIVLNWFEELKERVPVQ